MSRLLHAVLGFSLVICGDAQAMDDEPEVVASYKSSFSSGRIWREGNELQLQLNGDVMSDTSDEHVYHEMLVHPAMLLSEKARRILIIGGAEGATAREVLRHTCVENVTMVDIDHQLVNMCRTHLHPMHKGSFDSPKMSVVIADGIDFVRHSAAGSFDVVIVDGIDFSSTTAHGLEYGDGLFAPDFYHSVHRILSPRGILVQYMSDVERSFEMISAGFNDVVKFGVDIWSYPGYGARFLLAGKGRQEVLAQVLLRKAAQALPSLNLKFLTVVEIEKSLLHTDRRLKGGGGGVGGEGCKTNTCRGIMGGSLGLFGLCFGCWFCNRKKKVAQPEEDKELLETKYADNNEESAETQKVAKPSLLACCACRPKPPTAPQE